MTFKEAANLRQADTDYLVLRASHSDDPLTQELGRRLDAVIQAEFDVLADFVNNTENYELSDAGISSAVDSFIRDVNDEVGGRFAAKAKQALETVRRQRRHA